MTGGMNQLQRNVKEKNSGMADRLEMGGRQALRMTRVLISGGPNRTRKKLFTLHKDKKVAESGLLEHLKLEYKI